MGRWMPRPGIMLGGLGMGVIVRRASWTNRAVRAAIVAALLVMAGGSAIVPNGAVVSAAPPPTAPPIVGGLRISRLSSPGRSVVSDGSAWVATFTDGSRTVSLAGPGRTFAEASTPDRVVTQTWVRLLPAAFRGTVDTAWLARARADRSADVLATAFQYVSGAPSLRDAFGVQVAGDASYGPLLADGSRQEGSDFSDYLGVTWTYPDGALDPPEVDQFLALDCSGFVRMVFGYRGGVAISLRLVAGAIPRRAFEQAASAPGIIVITNRGVVPTSRTLMAAGDLVFFDASTDDGSQLDHVGIFLGRDTAGHDRFISSRKTADGPTMGDLAGRSVLDGTGLYARSFRAARRI